MKEFFLADPKTRYRVALLCLSGALLCAGVNALQTPEDEPEDEPGDFTPSHRIDPRITCLSFRLGPGINWSMQECLEPSTPLQVLETMAGLRWLRVRLADLREGWVFGAYVVELGEVEGRSEVGTLQSANTRSNPLLATLRENLAAGRARQEELLSSFGAEQDRVATLQRSLASAQVATGSLREQAEALRETETEGARALQSAREEAARIVGELRSELEASRASESAVRVEQESAATEAQATITSLRAELEESRTTETAVRAELQQVRDREAGQAVRRQTRAEVQRDHGPALVAVDEPLAPQRVQVPEPLVLVREPVAAPVDVVAEADVVAEIDVVDLVRAWAEAWQEQRVDDYLSYYGEDFVPEAGASRSAWTAVRRERLALPVFVTVVLRGIEIRAESDDRAEVRFVQEYTSDRFSDVVHKVLELVQVGDSWKIVSERVE